jgi:ArsR family transcriptional regulator
MRKHMILTSCFGGGQYPFIAGVHNARNCIPTTFQILSDETRLGIVLLLREMGGAVRMRSCTALEQSQPKTSRHLAMLRESGLLLDRKQGKWVHYRLSPHIQPWAALVIEQAWLSQQV